MYRKVIEAFGSMYSIWEGREHADGGEGEAVEVAAVGAVSQDVECGFGHCVVIDVIGGRGSVANGVDGIGMEMEDGRVKGEIAIRMAEIIVKAGGVMTVFVLSMGYKGAGGNMSGLRMLPTIVDLYPVWVQVSWSGRDAEIWLSGDWVREDNIFLVAFSWSFPFSHSAGSEGSLSSFATRPRTPNRHRHRHSRHAYVTRQEPRPGKINLLQRVLLLLQTKGVGIVKLT
mmetsp:Transcript_1695/g.3782  ORF Transcript_1695/g.3782 Transcript_1695/m.3782 type:complete len:228 (+) Transcript_1695:616-1299(+)